MTHPRLDARRATQAWEKLMRVHAQLLRQFADDDIWNPVSLAEYDILYALETAGCRLHARDIQKAVLLSQPTLSRTVERLEKRGFVERDPDPQDGRAALVSLTPAGRKARTVVGRKHALAITQRLGAALRPDELDTLTELLDKVEKGNTP
ncbi:MAG TPA: MarR family transcriptional regulator [Pseudoclavibacter sp.]|nr:MarR family transcriptional regulator [Pseudoclavibacter sp.]